MPRASDGDYARDGYTMLRGLVAADKLARALRLLNSHLGSASLAADLDATGLGTEYEDAEHAGGGVVKLGSGHLCTAASHSSAIFWRWWARTRDASPPPSAAAGGESRIRLARRWRSVSSEAVCAGRARRRGGAAGLARPRRLLLPTDAAKYNDKKSFDFVLGIFLRGRDARTAACGPPGSHLRPAAGEASATARRRCSRRRATPSCSTGFEARGRPESVERHPVRVLLQAELGRLR